MTLEQLNVVISAETSGLNKALDNTKKKLDNTKKEVNKSTSSIGQAFGGLAKKFALAQLAVKGIEKVIHKVIEAFKEGIKNAYAFSKATGSELSKNLDAAKSSLTYYANSLGAILIPILNSVIPLFTKIMDAVSGFNNKIAESIAILQNKSNYTVAKKTAEQYEKLNRQTFGFDELNVVNSDSKQTQMFEEKDVDTGSKLYKLINKIKSIVADVKKHVNNLFDKVNFSEVGTRLKDAFCGVADGIIDIFKTIFDNSFGFLKKQIEFFANSKTLSTIIDISPDLVNMLSGALEILNTVLDNIFGILESLYNSVIKPIAEYLDTVVSGILEDIRDWWQADGEPIVNDVITLINDVGSDVKYLFNKVLGPIFENIKVKLTELFENHIRPMFRKVLEVIQPIIELIKILYENVLQPILRWIMDKLVKDINFAIDFIWGIIEPLISGIIDNIGNVIDTLKGIINFIIGVFTGNWKRAWEGIKQVFTSIWESIKTSFKSTINFMIGLINGMLRVIVAPINSLIGMLNKFQVSIPDWSIFGDLRGKSFGFNFTPVTAPQIPLLAQGGIINKATLAMLGENGKEAVVPLENNTDWVDKLADRLTANTPTKLELNVDGKALGYAVINNINSITRQTGVLQLRLA